MLSTRLKKGEGGLPAMSPGLEQLIIMSWVSIFLDKKLRLTEIYTN